MTDLIGSILIDTNILIYIYDFTDPIKQQKAFDVVDQLICEHRAVLNTQILGEFFSVATRSKSKRDPLLNQSEAIGRIQTYLTVCEVLPITTAVIQETSRGIHSHQFSYWDAQIWATARVNSITEIYSEDFSSGSIVDGVKFTNPFI